MTPPNRVLCWTIFWMALLGAPALAYCSLTLNNDSTFLGSVLGGAVISGFALARRLSKTVRGLVLKGILFSLAAAMVYAGLFFVGCVIAFSEWVP